MRQKVKLANKIQSSDFVCFNTDLSSKEHSQVVDNSTPSFLQNSEVKKENITLFFENRREAQLRIVLPESCDWRLSSIISDFLGDHDSN